MDVGCKVNVVHVLMDPVEAVAGKLSVTVNDTVSAKAALAARVSRQLAAVDGVSLDLLHTLSRALARVMSHSVGRTVLRPNFMLACLECSYEEHCQARKEQGKSTLSQYDWLSSPAAADLGGPHGHLVDAHLGRGALRKEWLQRFHQGIAGEQAERVMLGRLWQMARLGDLAIRERLYKRLIGHVQKQLAVAFASMFRRVLVSVRLAAGVVGATPGEMQGEGGRQIGDLSGVSDVVVDDEIAAIATQFAEEELQGSQHTLQALEAAKEIRRQQPAANQRQAFCIGD